MERKGRDRSRSPKKSKSRSKSPSKGKKKSGQKNRSNAVQLPSEWTRAELMEKLAPFAKLTMDKSSGSGSLEATNKRILTEETIIIIETIRRYTEIQHISFKKCLLTDETFLKFVEVMRNLRHLKSLNLCFNALSSETVKAIIEIATQSSRKLEALDLRENNISSQDGQILYNAFPTIRYLNGINVQEIK
jgi:hypothetical protein